MSFAAHRGAVKVESDIHCFEEMTMLPSWSQEMGLGGGEGGQPCNNIENIEVLEGPLGGPVGVTPAGLGLQREKTDRNVTPNGSNWAPLATLSLHNC